MKKELTYTKDQKIDTKSKKSNYSKNPNFKEIDGGLEIDEITRKIDTFINV